MDFEVLKRMIAEDEFGLLEVKVNAPVMTEEQRLVASFDEIVQFVETNGKEPGANPANMTEFTLAARLKALRDDPALREALGSVDDRGLLAEPEPPKSLAEALASDDSGLLDSDGDLLTPTHVPAVTKKTTMPDEVASRKKCEDFDTFEGLFELCQADIRAGRRQVKPFKNEQQIRAEAFYVQKGVLVYVAEVGPRTKTGGRSNARLRCIYENGSESGVLLRSLSAELYKDGRLVTDPQETLASAVEVDPDAPTASIYVLRSLSTDDQVQSVNNLHKIGSTKQSVEARIAGAASDPTFLNAPVEIVAVYKVPVGAESTLEKMLHHLFAEACLDVWFETASGVATVDANEWFSVPLPVIDEAIDLISSEAIGSYRYDREEQALVLGG